MASCSIDEFRSVSRMRRTHFNPVRVNNKWQMDRNAFLGNTTKTSDKSVSMPPNFRRGTGNRELVRHNFIAPKIAARDPVDFDKINAINLAQFGQKVQLSEKTLGDLLGIEVPDNRDLKWIAEFNRRKAAGETDAQLKEKPPLGRPQRTIRRNINLGETKTNLDEGLQVVKTLIEQGRAETVAQRAILGAEVAKLVANMDRFEKMSVSARNEIIDAINRVNVPVKPTDAGITERFYNRSNYAGEAGLVNLFLLSKIKEANAILGLRGENALTREKPVLGTRGRPIRLSSMVSLINSGQILDIERRRMIKREDFMKVRGLERFVSPELAAALPNITDWKTTLEGAHPQELIDVYNNTGTKPPKALETFAKSSPLPPTGSLPDPSLEEKKEATIRPIFFFNKKLKREFKKKPGINTNADIELWLEKNAVSPEDILAIYKAKKITPPNTLTRHLGL